MLNPVIRFPMAEEGKGKSREDPSSIFLRNLQTRATHESIFDVFSDVCANILSGTAVCFHYVRCNADGFFEYRLPS